jgi:hypothetical protein
MNKTCKNKKYNRNFTYKNKKYNRNFKKHKNNNKNNCDDEETDDDDSSDRSVSTEETEYDIHTPLIDGLVKIRNGNKTNNSSNHIAAIFPDECHFLHNYNSFTITKGINSDKTGYGNKNVRTHAEMDALRKTHNLVKCNKIKKRKKMSLLILRVNRNGKLCDSAPCLHCTMQLLKSKNIIFDKIYFSINNEKIVCIKFSDWLLNPSQHVTSGWRTLQKKNIAKRKNKYKHKE